MNYSYLSGFIYCFGDGVGEFLGDEEKSHHCVLGLREVVCGYIDERGLLSSVILGVQIRSCIKRNMSLDGLAYVDPPFNQDTSFPEEYFEGDLYDFLTSVLGLLDAEIKARGQKVFHRLIGRR
ncbi:hypothetical protein [Pseudomonas sp. rhizo25]|uniref:hypothetical protein n=1 Tax=Pseudomonas sp. rhizo25 TaxID=3059675 RepID=UPI0028911095|nr:hypothetical protein [Pseudomonas sp. rhizo25]MDT3231735.1 hypothetical protein [Pseudomonas sp. rhizo25]